MRPWVRNFHTGCVLNWSICFKLLHFLFLLKDLTPLFISLPGKRKSLKTRERTGIPETRKGPEKVSLPGGSVPGARRKEEEGSGGQERGGGASERDDKAEEGDSGEETHCGGSLENVRQHDKLLRIFLEML